jgi:hypothetical protein
MFIKVALRLLMIKDLLPIATTSSQHSSKPHVGCRPSTAAYISQLFVA